MVETTELFREMSLLLVVAATSHYVIKKFRQPTIIGEIGLGILLGPTFLSFLFDPDLIALFAALGAIFLLFLIGLETDFRAIYTRKNVLVAAGGVILPFAFGFVAAYFMVPPAALGANATQFTMAAFVGAALTATSTAIAASVLLELGLLRDEVAKTIMGAAVVDDILGLLVLSMVVGVSGPGGLNAISIAQVAITAVAFIAVSIIVGVFFFSRIVVRFQTAGMKLGLKHGGFMVALAITFLYAFLAEIIGLSAIIGAFVAGTMFASTPLRDEFSEGAGYLGAVFTPIFFISLGLLVDLRAVAGAPDLLLFAGVLIAIGIATKVVGCWFPARASRMSRNEATAVSWGMTPRGEVGLIVALTALTAQVIGNSLFGVIVLVMIVVSVLPAPFLKRALEKVARERQAQKAEAAGKADVG